MFWPDSQAQLVVTRSLPDFARSGDRVSAVHSQPIAVCCGARICSWPAESNLAAQSWLAAFRDQLAKLGWQESSNLRTELRWSAGIAERYILKISTRAN